MTILDPVRAAYAPPSTPSPHDDDDAARLRAAVTERDAFAPVYARYVDRIYAYCYRRLGDAQDAEDVTSAIFARALASLEGYRGGSVAAWLFRIAHHQIIDHVRARKANVSLDAMIEREDGGYFATPENAPLDHVLSREEAQALRRAIAGLSQEEQNLLALRITAGLSAEETGAVIGKSAGTVRVAVHRAINRLRALMRRDYADREEG